MGGYVTYSGVGSKLTLGCKSHSPNVHTLSAGTMVLSGKGTTSRPIALTLPNPTYSGAVVTFDSFRRICVDMGKDFEHT